ncbi:uncharacterized protein LOC129988377 isoform X2 [Argiope bruennichi]|uniref:Transmembrane protein n=1 Tax=Argiope bruennichi TaxID=94029 RepID=A0A8T0ECT6_ARGBR|nr:uncharacterized protein LOC129988377 isoform X2 [Argiope bruennichi]KAF8769885.1 hypothetical protein HNY73_017482 [Argiope bruennichi]
MGLHSTGMLLLRYQRQRQAEAEEGAGGLGHTPDHDMRRKISDRDLKGDSHRAATRSTLICIFVCGSALLSLGLVVLFVGIYVPGLREDPTPWLVIGPTCIVLGILVLLLSVEIIIKLRKISAASSDSNWTEEKTPSKQSLMQQEPPKAIPVVLHPATPMQQLDPNALPVEVVQHR